MCFQRAPSIHYISRLPPDIIHHFHRQQIQRDTAPQLLSPALTNLVALEEALLAVPELVARRLLPVHV